VVALTGRVRVALLVAVLLAAVSVVLCTCRRLTGEPREPGPAFWGDEE
jgi:hypothetical protein